MEKKLLFVFNPYAGKGQIKNHLWQIIDLFVKGGYQVTVHPTQSRLDALRVVQDKASDYDLLVCSGGDGTFNETVRGLMLCEKKPPLGYIPAGTINDFSRNLGLSKKMPDAAEAILRGVPVACDVGAFNDEFFTYIAAFGVFTDVSYQTPQQSKNILGRLAYIFEGMKRLPSLKDAYHLVVEYDNQVIEDDFLFGMVTNATSVGGFKGIYENNMELDDGLFEVSLIKYPKTPLDMQGIINALLKREAEPAFIYSFKASKLCIFGEREVSWTLDGEFGGNPQNVKLENKKCAIQVIKGAQS